MGETVTRQRLLIAFVAMLAAVGVRIADALPQASPTLEQQAEVEFLKAGIAVRERLNREATGDPIGASIAAHEAELHRYRYLDLKRELTRLHPQAAPSPSVEELRDPFLPHGFSSAVSGASTTRAVSKAAGGRGEVTRTNFPSWDMYRPRLSREGADTASPEPPLGTLTTTAAATLGQATDMYARDDAKRASGAQRPPSVEAPIASADAPQQPFLVYREQLVDPGTRK